MRWISKYWPLLSSTMHHSHLQHTPLLHLPHNVWERWNTFNFPLLLFVLCWWLNPLLPSIMTSQYTQINNKKLNSTPSLHESGAIHFLHFHLAVLMMSTARTFFTTCYFTILLLTHTMHLFWCKLSWPYCVLQLYHTMCQSFTTKTHT